MTGFRGEKSTKSRRVTEWNSKRDDRDALTTREQGVLVRGGLVKCTHTHTHTKHDASLCHSVMDGAHRLINQTQWKGRMLRRVFGTTLPHALGCRERRDVSGISEQMHAHREREGRAWPNLARLMKNGQESAYLACPSLPSTATPPHFLLLLSSTLCLLLHTLHALSASSVYPWFPHLIPYDPHINTDIPACHMNWLYDHYEHSHTQVICFLY